LVYVGRVGTGWDGETACKIRRALAPLARSTASLAQFDADIAYAEITDDGMVRHPVFKAALLPCRSP